MASSAERTGPQEEARGAGPKEAHAPATLPGKAREVKWAAQEEVVKCLSPPADQKKFKEFPYKETSFEWEEIEPNKENAALWKPNAKSENPPDDQALFRSLLVSEAKQSSAYVLRNPEGILAKGMAKALMTVVKGMAMKSKKHGDWQAAWCVARANCEREYYYGGNPINRSHSCWRSQSSRKK